jgi:hypothetical protein
LPIKKDDYNIGMVDLSMAIFSHNQIVIPVLNDCKWKNPVGLDKAYENH